MHLLQQRHDFAADGVKVGVDVFQRARRLVLVEVAVEGDFVTDYTNFAIKRVGFAGVDPGIRHVWQHFFNEVGFVAGVNAAGGVERDVFKVAQVAVGLVFQHLPAIGKQAVERPGSGFVHFLDDFGCVRVFPADRVGKLFFLFAVERQRSLFHRLF